MFKLKSQSTRRVVQLGFAGAAVVCLVLGAAGWWTTQSVHQSDEDLRVLQDLASSVENSVRGTTDVLLTGDSKSSRENFQRRLANLRAGLAKHSSTDTSLRQPVESLVQQIDAFGKISRPSPDNDDAMIAYGKLSAAAETAVGALEKAVLARSERATQNARQMMMAIGGGALASVLLVTVCAIGVLRRLKNNLGGELEHAQVLMQRVGQGDLSPIVLSPQVSKASVIGGLAVMVEQLRGSIGRVQETAALISSASGEISAGSMDLSQRTELNAASLQQTASAMEHLAATVGQTAESARTAQQLAQSASTVAERGGSVVSQVVQTMESIQGGSRRISDIISTIDGIAFQTNILALNAAVEAARAGEAGRGFAVVASEVRALAQRSAGAAREIKGLISASVESVNAGTELVSSAGQTMQEIVKSVERVSDIIGKITAATIEQSEGISQVNVSVSQLDEATQRNSALVEQSTAAAASLKDQAQSLTGVVAAFRVEGAAA